jgi:hypothetical protein
MESMEMKEKLLFVTKGGENCDEGFSYVLELAKSLNAGVELLMIYGKGVMDKYEDMMAAVAFAEAGDHETVRELMNAQDKKLKDTAEKKIKELTEKCRETSVELGYQTASEEPINAIKDFLKSRPNINMVLLSPNISGDRKLLDIRKMLKSITKPIVTIMAAKART